ncbi:iron chelate uptake ABC transporter family permease subunit [Lysinibacter sp. HNR]|uniref:iron chelate uptake ABC transporter family permease subunit n=1 Tax=Lysinibacter sp. HNR TaxID=3031408 RepID=UPI002435B5AC|nr:iron chelate uptake ABC transporter family permease subunit [Lysinibacter sp. HNR]WGD36714.1 iron chelate uptake ABC transporter family permease subunit [Lysinibacter sp. HNR]
MDTVKRALPRPKLRLAIFALVAIVLALCFLLLFVRGSWSFAMPRRFTLLGAITIAAFAQGVGTVIFHTVTHNRILTPSIIGFDSLYVLMQTLAVFLFGGTIIAQTEGIPKLVVQTVMMVSFAVILYRWLFSGKFGSLYLLLLVGVVLGISFSSVAVFLQRLLSPTEYDLLSVKLFGRLSTVKAEYLPLAFAVCGVVAIFLWLRRRHLDVILLGREQATNVGVNHRGELTLMLILVAVLIAFSTALAGPMTFFGFIVATLAYQCAGDYRHQYVMPMAFLLGFITLVAGQFVMQHIFYAGGLFTILIEFVGGILFLVLLLRKKGHL